MRIRMPCAAFLHCCIFHSVQAARAALPQRRALSSASLLRRSASLSFISSHIRSWFTIPAIALSSVVVLLLGAVVRVSQPLVLLQVPMTCSMATRELFTLLL